MRGGVAVGRSLGQAASEQRVEGIGVGPRDLGWRFADVRQEHPRVGVTRIRNLAGEALEEDGGERVDVRRGRRRLTESLLGSRVVETADETAGVGDPNALAALGHAEVSQVYLPAIAEQDVLGLDISVYKTDRVRRVQGVGNRAKDLDHVARIKATVVHPVAQRRAPDEPHGKEELAVNFTGVVNRDDVRVVQGSDVLAFAPKPFAERLIAAELRGEYLERDLPPQRYLLGAIDDRHPADPEYVKNLVAAKRVARRHNRGSCRHLSPQLPSRIASSAIPNGLASYLSVPGLAISATPRVSPTHYGGNARGTPVRFLTPGDEVGGYRIEGIIGRGGMSIVYEARQLSLDRPVALKLLSVSDVETDSFKLRFRREALIQASLTHPRIVTVHDAGEIDGTPYIVMRLIPGSTLKALIDAGSVTPEQLLDLSEQVAEALDAAHAQNLVHRDVKPQNILVRPEGKAYLADFGLTKLLTEAGLTTAGQFVGTVRYIAPEQIIGGQPTGSVDIYSLAAVIYEGLTGCAPFERRTQVAVLYAHTNESPPRPSIVAPHLPAAIDEVIARGMAKEPGERYATAVELVRAARSVLRAAP